MIIGDLTIEIEIKMTIKIAALEVGVEEEEEVHQEEAKVITSL